MKKKRDFTITIKVKKRTGHSPRPTGAGPHEDSRTKRSRTRAAQTKKAIRDETIRDE